MKHKSLFALSLLVVAPLQLAPAARIEIEAESFRQGNLTGAFYPLPPKLLSGGGQLMHKAATPAQARYDFIVKEAGEYRLWAREFGWSRNGSSAVRWRVDDGAWQTEEQSWGLPHNSPAGLATWHEWGRVKLAPGSHVFEFETIAPVYKISPATLPPPQTMPGGGAQLKKSDEIPAKDVIEWTDQHQLSVDVFLFSTEPLHPAREHGRIFQANGLLNPNARPGERWLFNWDIDDFSPTILDEIAGRPKDVVPLRREGDKFFAGDRPFHIWGASGPIAPEHWEAEYYAQRARRLGINVVRLHTQDGELCNPKHNKNYVLDPERLDRMNHFIACLKRQGIYVMIDPLYNWVFPMTERDGLPPGTVLKGRERVQFYFDTYLQQLNRDFIKKILDPINPHTGLRNADDPAVAFFSVANENSIFFYFLNNISPHHQRMLDGLFNEWLAKKYPTRAALVAAWTDALNADEDPAKGTVARRTIHELATGNKTPKGTGNWTRTADQVRFYYEVQSAFYNSAKNYVREELGGRHILFNGSGWWAGHWLENVEMASNLPGMDFYDQHQYTKGPIVNNLGKGQILHNFAAKRPAGFPWVATEWNDGYNVAGPMVMAAYGALQGWNGLFQYRLDTMDGLNLSKGGWGTPPSVLLQYPLASLAFARRYVKEADVVWRRVLDTEDIFDMNVPHVRPGLHTIIGRCEAAFGAAEKVEAPLPSDQQTVISQTGELTWQAGPPARVTINAPKLQGLVGFADGRPVTLDAMTLTLEPDLVSVVAGAVDDRSLTESRRILLCAVGEPQPMRDIPEAEQKQRDGEPVPMGTRLPRGAVRFAQPVTAVYALDIAGRRQAPVNLGDGGRTFHLQTDQPAAWYEVVREP